MAEVLVFAVALVSVAIVGRGKFGPLDITDKLTSWQRVGLVALGLIVAGGAGLKWGNDIAEGDFRLKGATLVPVNRVDGPCPADQIFEATLSTEGGSGSVTFRLYTDGGFRGAPQTVTVERSGTTVADVRVRVDRPTNGGSIADDVARLRVLSPERLDARPLPFQIECD